MSKWDLDSEPRGAADETAVDELLGLLNPLRAEKFVPPATQPATQPEDRYVISIRIGDSAQPVEITFIDPGGARSAIGEYNGLRFEVSRTLVDRLTSNFTEHAPSHAEPMPSPQ